MSPEIMILIILVGGMLLLMAMGLEIAWSIGIMTILGMMLFVGQSPFRLAWNSWSTTNSFVLTALPLFILMGSVLGNTGVAEYLISGVNKLVGSFPGGLATSVIVANAIFGAMSGSTMAAVSVFGKIAYPAMEKEGYHPELALGCIATASFLAPLIPPSLVLIVYGAWQGLSIVSLLAAGLIPGLTLMVLLMVFVIIRVKLNPSLVPPPPPTVSWHEKLIALKEILPFFGMILAVLGVIFTGIMTPTEAASAGAFLSIVLSLAYRRLTWPILMDSLLDTAKVTCFALFIMAMAIAFSYVLNSAGIILLVSNSIMGLGLGKYSMLIFFYIMYIILGMFFDTWSMLFLTFPFVMPIIVGLGINPIWWGVVYVMASEQALVTPPYGLNLFVLKNVIPQHSIGTIVRGSLPFFIPLYINIALLMLFPQLALWLPSLLGR
ncbi:MAG: TRAP transporter large permease subunit [Chloroflexi bacterium]|nr:TRAP transporter large permease subunit [Chloroflexota bacterium]